MKVRKAKNSEEPSSIQLEKEEITLDEEDRWESIVTIQSESESEESDNTTGLADMNPKYCHELVDISKYPPFMVNHLKPLAKWTPALGSSGDSNARLQWFKKALAYVKFFFATGIQRGEIMRRLGISDKTYDSLEARLMEKEGGKFLSMSIAQRYYIYVLQMEACIRMLNHYVEVNIEDINDKRANVVNAIKTIANIHKDTLITGRELGIINVEDKGPRRLGELNLAVMDTEELKELFEKRFGMFKQLINDSTVLSGPYARLLLEQKKKVFDVVAEETQLNSVVVEE